MKTVEQLLELSKNPYYVFTNEEKMVLDDFLLMQKAEYSVSSTSEKKQSSESNTHVRVRNVVEKTIPEIEESGV